MPKFEHAIDVVLRYAGGFVNDPADPGTQLFDTCGNTYHATDHRPLQRAIVACGERIVIDGAIRPGTVSAANRIPAQQLLESMRTEQARFYTDLVMRKRVLNRFLRGWLRRAAS